MSLNLRTGILFGVLLVIIVVAALLLNNPVSAPEENADTQSRSAVSGPLLPADSEPDAIRALTVADNAQGVSVDLTRADDAEANDWTLVNAADGITLDQAAIDAAIQTLTGLEYADRFTADDVALFTADAFGLDEPQAVITYTGDLNGRITVGDTNPTGTRYYAWLDEDETTIYALPLADVDAITRLAANPPIIQPPTPTPVPRLNTSGPVFSQFNQNTAQRFEIRANADDGLLILSRDTSGGDWQITQSSADVNGELDQMLVNIALSAFGTLQTVDAIEGADLAPLGLDAPAYTLVAEQSDGTLSTLQIGGEDPTGSRYYALVDAFETVAVIAQADIDPLLDLIDAPPLAPQPEATPEATPETTPETGDS